MPESKTPIGSFERSVCIRCRWWGLHGPVFNFLRSALHGFVERGGDSARGNGGGEIGDGGFVGAGGDSGGMLVVAPAGKGVAVAAHAFENGAGKGVAVLAGGNEATIHRMVHEPAFEQDAGDSDVSDHDKACAFDPAVEKPQVA